MKQTALFICVHNSARSQMAEAWLNYVCGEYFEAESAGLQPGQMNPIVVAAMAEVGIDLSRKATRSVDEVLGAGRRFDYVFTVCSESDAAGCPVFPGPAKRLHWPFRDPSKLTGSDEEKLREVRGIRNEIRLRVEEWCEEICPGAFAPTATG
jgi:arsenate reductase (thioredoxin)